MFYNNRKTIYIILIIIAIILSFLCGKRIGNGSISNEKTTKSVVQNIHYNDTLSVKGNKYSLNYSIVNALFMNKSSMQFNVNLINNTNVATIKVLAKDQDNNVLQVEPSVSDDNKSLVYAVILDANTTKISIYVYPLTKEMMRNKALDYNTIPFKTSILNVSLLKQQQIQNLQN
ncbi:hypothetical protein LGK95_20755 [Clostridium algoriphilum]|uniref:hypothetical protein n=1 Tax=Clostridium algoriphilum TaxID=198347 RepID=UPI001CF46722|nr:hypothetical protein [Clostridium algoriphilum]MCB2295895.1 hypothetical protein [Clostridium algoriphilum]